jgi:hypothetical protein
MLAPDTVSARQFSLLIGLPDAPALLDVRTDEEHAAGPRLFPASFRRGFRTVTAWAPDCADRSVVVACQRGLKLSQAHQQPPRRLGPVLVLTAPPALGRRRSLLVAGCFALAGRRAAAQVLPRRYDFEEAAAGGRPPGFAFTLTGGGAPVRWVVLEDPSSPAGPKVLAEFSKDRTSDRFPLAILEGVEARDVALSVRFRPVSGSVDQAAGLVARLRDPRNYYIARANALEDNVRLYRVVDGRRVQFAGADVRVPRDRWQTLGMRVEGDRLAVSLDGRVVFTAADRTFADAGRVGLWTKADSVTHFDAFEVEALR